MPPITLADSKWASKPKYQTRAEQLLDDRDRAFRLLKRLYWKAESLLCSWNRAIDVLKSHQDGQRTPQQHSIIIEYSAREDGDTVQSMFKIDFFEFYVLLEKYIVLCLDICGVRVPRKDPLGKYPNASKYDATFGSHQFHANLLTTLDQPCCPLHEALGQQDVRIYLGQAKDYRNRWKDADEVAEEKGSDEDNGSRKHTLEQLELPLMIMTILGGLEKAREVIEKRQASSNGDGGGVTEKSSGVNGMIRNNGAGRHAAYNLDDEEMEDAPFEAVDDAMEWE
ncbi:hypothetical protein K432DRAFT_440594 [Lepidopterella palustris CBS 459.81]|uniref:Uncharacterized protein n=1 Tax=Lepidopterella palustris CBS 459.81 TaxID=1314670 RepID=A0A8E2JIN4_9PEZI|nr:hypothetical protein K432DRAFT_440594 [Lepidopterella palustris CBS 459.81]